MPTLSKARAMLRSRERHSICWYTGIDLAGLNSKFEWSIEHLVPQALLPVLKVNREFNVVGACKAINSAVGNAPLKVKFALREYLHNQTDVHIWDKMSPGLKLEVYLRLTQQFLDREGYEKRRIQDNVTFAFLDDEGWFERGEMGWFACVSDEKDKGDWFDIWMERWNRLSDDAVILAVDCHI